MPASRVETFEPEDLATLGQIFDETWAVIAAALQDSDAESRAAARTRLAGLLLELSGREASPQQIRRVVLHMFLEAPGRSVGGPQEMQLSST